MRLRELLLPGEPRAHDLERDCCGETEQQTHDEGDSERLFRARPRGGRRGWTPG